MIRICGGGDGIHHIWKDFRFPLDDGMPTSRLLLAAMDRKQRMQYSSEISHDALDFLAEKGFYRGIDRELTVQGHLILCEDYPPAAFGYGVRQGLDADEVARMGATTAREINIILHTQRNIF